MRLSTIAVCLLLVSPPSALACWKDAPEQTGWFQEMPSSSQGTAWWETADGAKWDGTFNALLMGVGLASITLVVVSFRAFSRAVGWARMQPSDLDGNPGVGGESPESSPSDSQLQYV
jgi:hypothetical protein